MKLNIRFNNHCYSSLLVGVAASAYMCKWDGILNIAIVSKTERLSWIKYYWKNEWIIWCTCSYKSVPVLYKILSFGVKNGISLVVRHAIGWVSKWMGNSEIMIQHTSDKWQCYNLRNMNIIFISGLLPLCFC